MWLRTPGSESRGTSHDRSTEKSKSRVSMWARAYERPAMEARGWPKCGWEIRSENPGPAGEGLGIPGRCETHIPLWDERLWWSQNRRRMPFSLFS